MPNIYNLPQEVEKALNAYYDCFDPDTGELAVSEEELTAAQSALEELQNQSDEILKWYLEDRANRLARIAMFENEVDRLKAHLKREAREVDRTNLLIGRAFERVYAGKPLNIGTFTLSYRNSAAVWLVNEKEVPEEFKRYGERSLTLAQIEELEKKDPGKEIRFLIDTGAPDKALIMERLKELEEKRSKMKVQEGEPLPEKSEEEKKMEFAFIERRQNLQIK